MCELGWKSLGVLELTALPSIDENAGSLWSGRLTPCWPEVATPLYLCHWMRQSGLADLLPSLRTVWVGVSGGSMVMAPNIGEEAVAGSRPPVATHAGDGRFLDFPAPGSRGPAGQFHGGGREMGRQMPVRRTRLTTRPPSRWPTALSKSSPRGTGSCLPPKAEMVSRISLATFCLMAELARPRGRDCSGLVLDADSAQVPPDPATVGGRLGEDSTGSPSGSWRARSGSSRSGRHCPGATKPGSTSVNPSNNRVMVVRSREMSGVSQCNSWEMRKSPAAASGWASPVMWLRASSCLAPPRPGTARRPPMGLPDPTGSAGHT